MAKTVNGVITFDEQGRVASFEASGDMADVYTPGTYKYSHRISYAFEPLQPSVSEVGGNSAKSGLAAGLYKFAGSAGTELSYDCEPPPLPSPLLEIGLRVDFSGGDNGEKRLM